MCRSGMSSGTGQTRLAAERAAARSQLAPLEHAAWWDKANVKQITDALRVVVTWHAVDPRPRAQSR